MVEFLAPREGFVHADALGGAVLLEGQPTIVALANSWIIINVGGPPTGDKPTVTLEPPRDPCHISSFLNIRVADIHASYQQWRDRGADFLIPPTDRGHELRCDMRGNVPGLPPRPNESRPFGGCEG